MKPEGLPLDWALGGPIPLGVEQARSTLPSFAGPSIPGSIASGLISKYRTLVGIISTSFRTTLKLSEKPSAVVTTKSNERRSRVTQASTVLLSKQRAKRSALAISIRADHHKGRLGEAFGFEPSPASPTPKRCECVPGD